MMTTMVWMEQEWTDYKLKWDPDDYGGIMKVSCSTLRSAQACVSHVLTLQRCIVSRASRRFVEARLGVVQQVSSQRARVGVRTAAAALITHPLTCLPTLCAAPTATT